MKIFSLIFILAFVTGCGFWTNFKTYFNTYYNANRIFEETEDKLIKDRAELFYFEEKNTPNNLSKSFEEVIEKTSSILQHSKGSDFIDEALLMTGKSFYYQKNYSRALRKFNELASIQESELHLENKLWIGKTSLQLREFKKAIKILDEVKAEAIDREEDDIIINVYRSKIGYLIYLEDYQSATAEIDEFFETNIDDELRAEILYELGRFHKLNQAYESAEKAFARVEEYSPTFEIDFNSKFEVAKLEGELGHIDESLAALQKLRAEDKFSDSWGEIDLEIGKIFYDRNEIEDAFDKFTEVDTTYAKTESASIAGFYRAEILENHYHDYDSALVFYKKTSSSIAPVELRNSARKKSTLLNQYIVNHNKLNDLKTQLIYLTDNEVFLQDSLDYVERVRLDSIRFADENTGSVGGNSRKKQPKPKYKQPLRPKITVDSVHALNSKYYFELANLLFSEFDDPDSAFYYYKLSLDEQEENPNEAQTYYAMGNYYLIKEDKPKADSMFTIVYNKFQFDPIRNEAAKQIGKPLYDFDKDPVEEEYVVAEAIYDSLNYDSAINKFFNIYEENPKSIYASKSLYAIGFILENDLDMPDSAASIYNLLSTEYRTSEYAKAVTIKLTGHKKEQASLQAKQDSIQNASEARLDSLKKVSEVIEAEALVIDSVISRETTNIELFEDSDSNDTKEIIKDIENSEEIKEYKEENNGIETISDDSLNVKTNEKKKKISSGAQNIPDQQYVDLPTVGRDIYRDQSSYYVQVSSWKTKEIADRELIKLRAKKYNAFIKGVFIPEFNALYYRVRVGPYDSYNSAKDVRLKLNKY